MFQQVIPHSSLWLVSLCAVLIIGNIGCGEEDNSQPIIEAIRDIKINVDAESTVEVNITDADVRDTHSIRASSSDKTIAIVSANPARQFLNSFIATLSISSTLAEGVTTVTVSVTDDSGQDNAESTPVTFQVTVEPYVNKGRCAVGMVLEAGESCTYFADGAEVLFYVKRDLGCRGTETAEGKRLRLCVSPRIERDDFFNTRFAAEKNADESWTVKRIP